MQVEQIETAALLHDVGKIHEEFAPLLRKEARLTDSETALMQTHAARSADLVGIISKFRGFIQESVLGTTMSGGTGEATLLGSRAKLFLSAHGSS